jgi:flagellin-like protein
MGKEKGNTNSTSSAINTEKLKFCVRAVSPVIATLLMIVIAVAASLLVYAWISGFTGFTTTNLSNEIQIPSFTSVNQNGERLLAVYVQNTGQGAVQFNKDGAVYSNDTLVPILTYTDADGIVNQANPGQLINVNVGQTISLVVQYTFSPGDYVRIKVVTVGGTSTQTSGTGPQSGSATANPDPVAAFFASSNGLTVTFDASGSSASDGTIISYAWNFGDGNTGTGTSLSHTYNSARTYTVSLTVTDNGGYTGSTSHKVTVSSG